LPIPLASAATNQTATEKLTWQPDDRVLFFTETQCPTLRCGAGAAGQPDQTTSQASICT
jgi:hypothetical protein